MANCQGRRRNRAVDTQRCETDKMYTCQECDYAAAKPAHLVQHLRTHSEQRPFACPVAGCSSTFKRQDHLNRHIKGHTSTRIRCTIPGCEETFSLKSNLERHLKRHNEDCERLKPKLSTDEKNLKCSYPECGKAFRYPSLLRSHEETVHEGHYEEIYCVYPGCGELFTSEATLLEHSTEAHPYLLCEVCGETISRRYYMRHVRLHGAKKPTKITCPYEGCSHHYTREGNLRQHINSAHLNLKPYVCSYDGCCKVFAHNCTRKKHELSAEHVHTGTNFEARELASSSVSKGGRKKVTFERVEDLYVRKAQKVKKPRQKKQKLQEDVEEPHQDESGNCNCNDVR